MTMIYRVKQSPLFECWQMRQSVRSGNRDGIRTSINRLQENGIAVSFGQVGYVDQGGDHLVDAGRSVGFGAVYVGWVISHLTRIRIIMPEIEGSFDFSESLLGPRGVDRKAVCGRLRVDGEPYYSPDEIRFLPRQRLAMRAELEACGRNFGEMKIERSAERRDQKLLWVSKNREYARIAHLLGEDSDEARAYAFIGNGLYEVSKYNDLYGDAMAWREQLLSARSAILRAARLYDYIAVASRDSIPFLRYLGFELVFAAKMCNVLGERTDQIKFGEEAFGVFEEVWQATHDLGVRRHQIGVLGKTGTAKIDLHRLLEGLQDKMQAAQMYEVIGHEESAAREAYFAAKRVYEHAGCPIGRDVYLLAKESVQNALRIFRAIDHRQGVDDAIVLLRRVEDRLV